MKPAIEKLPNDILLLKELVIESANEIVVLKEELQLLKSILFGRKSEKYMPEQDYSQFLLNFGEENEDDPFLEIVEDVPEIEVDSYKRRKSGRNPLAKHLPREEHIIDIPESDKLCECGCIKTVIGQETSEQLKYIPAKCKVIVNIRPKYACRNCEGTESNKPTVVIAPPPAQIIPKSFATASLLAYILASKYVDSLPFYRLSNMFARNGVQISRATMCNWALRVSALLKPIIELFLEKIIEDSYIHADETPFQVLKESGRKAGQKSYMWIFKTGDGNRPTILFHYSPTRSGKIPETIFSEFQGYIQTDGYAGYNYIQKKKDQIQLCCWAHYPRNMIIREECLQAL